MNHYELKAMEEIHAEMMEAGEYGIPTDEEMDEMFEDYVKNHPEEF